MKNPWTKPTHAIVEATSMCFGGFRATVMNGKTVVSSQHFATKGWGQNYVEKSYLKMKKWLADFGIN